MAAHGNCSEALLRWLLEDPWLRDIRQEVSIPVLLNEDLGLNSDAKEAVAFAILANECIRGQQNNMPSVTGAAHPVVMGKISL